MAPMASLDLATTPRHVRVGLLALGGFGILLGVLELALHLQHDPLADVHAYVDAGARLNAGIGLYDQPANANQAEFYRYPPLLAILFRPLAAMGFQVAAAVWEAIVISSFVAILWLLKPSLRTWTLVGVLSLAIGWSLAIGQAHVPMTLLMLIGTPWSIALAANLKILPALVAIWWIGRRDWRSLLQFAGWCAVLALIQLVLEPAGTLAFPGVLLDFGQVGQVRNLSPYVISPVLWAALVAVGGLVCLRLAPTRWGWAAAVVFSVLATPRLLVYQFMAFLAAAREPDTQDTARAPRGDS
jgi:hypothetical protein